MVNLDTLGPLVLRSVAGRVNGGTAYLHTRMALTTLTIIPDQQSQSRRTIVVIQILRNQEHGVLRRILRFVLNTAMCLSVCLSGILEFYTQGLPPMVLTINPSSVENK